MKINIIPGINYQNEKGVLISQYVAYLRKKSFSPVLKFAKDNNISTSLVKKYESGEYDYPSPLIASNFCRNFSLTPKEFVNKFTISKDEHFNKNEYLETLNSYYYNLPAKEDNAELVKDFIDIKTYDKKPRLGTYAPFYVPCDVIFSDGADFIAGAYFKYKKVHKNQLTLDAYKDLATAIANATVRNHFMVEDFRTVLIRNYLFVLSSKNAFDALFVEKDSFYLNEYELKDRCPINIILFLLPKHNSSSYYYFNVVGKDFINEEDHYYHKDK